MHVNIVNAWLYLRSLHWAGFGYLIGVFCLEEEMG
jgi:hypothetical protein